MRALIVEDDPVWRQLMSEILADLGFVVDAASSVEESAGLLKLHAYRAAVVDLSLSPDHNNTDGLRVLDLIQRLNPGCQAVLLTGFSTVELAVAAITKHGAFTFLRKENFQRVEFKNIIKRILTSAPWPGEEPASAPETRPESTPPAALLPQALIVDDDAGWRAILEDLLGELNFAPVSCASFGEALGLIRREKFSLAVVDLSLRETGGQNMDGLQLLKIAQGHRISTLVVSGLAEPEEIQRIYAEHEIAGYMEKQAFSRASFKRAVEAARRGAAPPDELGMLTEREREVLQLLSQGLTNKEIADKLVITTNTVKRHLKGIFEKLGVHTRAAAAVIGRGGR